MRIALAVQLSLFAAELIIGIVVNLYVKVPDVHPGSASLGGGDFGNLAAVLSWALLTGPIPLTLHVILGLALIGFGLGLVVLARGGGPLQATLIRFGALFTIGAAFNGGSFLIFGNDDNLSSLIMESLFTAAAAACYVITLVRAASRPAPTAADLTR